MSRNRKSLSNNTSNLPLLALLVGGIFIYRIFLSPLLKTLLGTGRFCKFSPSCSAYFMQSISEKGMLSGTIQWSRRFLRCQSFTGFSV